MRLLAIITSLWVITCLSFPVAAQSKKRTPTAIVGTQNLAAQINHAIQTVNPNAQVGITIKSMKLGDTLYTRNEKSLFVPASTLKIFTAEAALLYLGPEYKFPTRFVTDATGLRNGKIVGNVYLVNSGDPTLTYYDLADMMESLKAQNITEIQGNVYIDNTAYDQVTTGPGWLWKDKHSWYGAPISASIINHNSLSFQVQPTKPDNLAGIRNAHYYNAVIENNPKYGTPQTCYIKLNKSAHSALSISGCISNGHNTLGGSSVITDVMQYDKLLLQDLFKRAGIQVHGEFLAGVASNNLPELARHESKPVKKLISSMLKMSDNIIAGSLFKKIGALFTHRPGTWENGGTAVGQILSKNAALDLWRISLIDGSGLSRYNQVTPSQMMQLLDFAFHHSATNYSFISSLPIAGVDGTLKRRMRNIAWRVRAKTGTMSGVVSLAGYAISADKEAFAFVIIINGNHGSVWQYRELEDKIMNYLTHFSRR